MKVVQLLCCMASVLILACFSIPNAIDTVTGISCCTDALTKLLPCLSYFSQGKTDVPMKDCCTNLENPQCLCALIARLTLINKTLGLKLGPACKVGTKPATCPDLLGVSRGPQQSSDEDIYRCKI
ncbi:hypothetical protein KP509_33G062100 [Ceratopteris richardii]|uniref:Bifunctional inhibitor/plant lipid transfer protein/seed storage helical domain-containing protein n=1 Tax=Ceratopteris richardii TaxID=49495 RepID=A0A8T2QQE4_CERRI|nr:hypothetical protein KP509_33G062100 [Ceratopteris richardii]